MAPISTPLGRQVIGAAIEVHRALGPGLLESAYEMCLCYELARRGVTFARQVRIPVRYRDAELSCGFRADLIVERELLVELKSIDHVTPLHQAQMITYLKLTGLPQGLLINFNVPRLVDGLRSVLSTPRPAEAATPASFKP